MVVGKSSNSAPVLVSPPGNAPSGGKVDSAIAVSDQSSLPDKSSISTFMSQVSDLIKYVTYYNLPGLIVSSSRIAASFVAEF